MNLIRSEMFAGALGGIVIKSAGLLVSFLLAVVLARTLGPDGYGIYAHVLAILTILSIPTKFGLPNLIVRETAKAQLNEDWSGLLGVWRWSSRVSAILGIVMGMLGLVIAWRFFEELSQAYWMTFVFGLFALPLIVLSELKGAAIRGLRRVVIGQLGPLVLRPLFFVLLVLLLYVINRSEVGSPAVAMVLHGLAALCALVFSMLALRHFRPKQITSSVQGQYRHKEWIVSLIPLGMISAMQVINVHADVLILGIFYPSSEVGIYKVVVHMSVLAAFGLQAMNVFVAPHFARLYAQSDFANLQAMATFSARISTAITVLVLGGYVMFGSLLIAWIFGEEYQAGFGILLILTAGQAANAVFGSVGFLLNMTGNESDTLKGVALASILNVCLNLALIPPLGMYGAAISTALTLVLWNVILWRFVKLRLGVESTAFGVRRV